MKLSSLKLKKKILQIKVNKDDINRLYEEEKIFIQVCESWSVIHGGKLLTISESFSISNFLIICGIRGIINFK